MLHSQFVQAQKGKAGGKPLVVFLHGFLGAGDDWKAVKDYLTGYDKLFIDLPGHGESHSIQSTSFDAVCGLIHSSVLKCIETQKQSATRPICLVGYSLGARLAMYFVTEYFKIQSHLTPVLVAGLVIEGGNFGLDSQAARHARLANDLAWSERFKNDDIAEVLSDWYQQPVFSSLNHEQRQHLIAKRSVNLGDKLSQMLMSTSLAHQPDLLPQIRQLQFSNGSRPLYITGERDKKFTALAKHSHLDCQIIMGAGHNVHKEQPEVFASVLLGYLEQMGESPRKKLE
ncbi:2-succinyl-6-hydroxy-2, 4-cyclohexadiene-1-carboxylate synthase [Vibrio thalassae]|uniref:Putative 2-succinyl-6-hydroxy-2,4-cyclohexadiene-1-carboxylate synthase n=1 Tax=Vibrio thalassae TaxID=1243014 RepID=A0A240EHX3_9VIBR|nr:2-succinyl-6-hydroxy-2,4-cyclohexadiene-1-carboxylate synthase [Vibrio thalassae]SNX47575.1 2-succinyl-6-hydroxy-2, 4-cyclohexadiene-1-carboxylate synthase [Vibrio thalassae]